MAGIGSHETLLVMLDLILCMSHACSEFMCAMALLSLENTVWSFRDVQTYTLHDSNHPSVSSSGIIPKP